MKKISGKRSEDDAKIDLTPMLDVVFILLIFFVVTATFLSETSISAGPSLGVQASVTDRLFTIFRESEATTGTTPDH